LASWKKGWKVDTLGDTTGEGEVEKPNATRYREKINLV